MPENKEIDTNPPTFSTPSQLEIPLLRIQII